MEALGAQGSSVSSLSQRLEQRFPPPLPPLSIYRLLSVSPISRHWSATPGMWEGNFLPVVRVGDVQPFPEPMEGLG